eukprot:358343-Amphidinium_carterae.1
MSARSLFFHSGFEAQAEARSAAAAFGFDGFDELLPLPFEALRLGFEFEAFEFEPLLASRFVGFGLSHSLKACDLLPQLQHLPSSRVTRGWKNAHFPPC